MKRLFLILFSCFLATISHPQVVPEDAFSKLRSGDYKAAIRIYREKIAQKPMGQDIFMLGECYLKTDSIEQAKQQFEKILAGKATYFDDFETESCKNLADIYKKQKNYRKALYYYQLYPVLFIRHDSGDGNRLRFNFLNSNEQAKCYMGLGLIDSAVKVMTPYMFCTHKDLNSSNMAGSNYHNLEDSLKHDTVCRFYVSLLQKQYSNQSIKTEFKKAEQSFLLTEDRRAPDKNGIMQEDIHCSINIYGKHVVYFHYGTWTKEDVLLKEIQKPFYTKAYQLQQFRQLLICRLVRDLK